MPDENGDDLFKIFARPYLQEFLTWLFERFNVSIWTAASKSYALYIVDKFIIAGRTNRRLDYILFSHHCRESIKACSKHKCIDILSTPSLPLGFLASNTIIIDDHKEVFETQPSRCLRVKAFRIDKSSANTDKDLKRIMSQLEKYAR
jgi:TFIIF-interacting CTD phosphatase-like protein